MNISGVRCLTASGAYLQQQHQQLLLKRTIVKIACFVDYAATAAFDVLRWNCCALDIIFQLLCAVATSGLDSNGFACRVSTPKPHYYSRCYCCCHCHSDCHNKSMPTLMQQAQRESQTKRRMLQPRPNTGFPYTKEEAERAQEENVIA